jgi:hypothetical protein
MTHRLRTASVTASQVARYPRSTSGVENPIHEYTAEISDADGHTYSARAMGRQRQGRTVWEGWLEFSPVGGGGIVRRSPIETTQPNREALAYWASGIEPVYLEGALERAITARSDPPGPAGRK